MDIQILFKKFSSGDVLLWEEINKNVQNSSFLSSINWINFQKSLGKETDQYLIYVKLEDKETPVGNLYIEIFRRKIAKFAYSPWGPVVDWERLRQETGSNPSVPSGHLPFDQRGGKPLSEAKWQEGLASNDPTTHHSLSTSNLIDEFYKQFKLFCKRYIVENGLNLFRFDPLLPLEFKKALLTLGYKSSLAPAQAKDLWILDISKSKEDLKKGMADTNRNMINRATKAGVEIIKVGELKKKETTGDLLKEFYNLMAQTTSRKGFSTYTFEYFKKQYEVLNTEGITEIYLAKYQGQYLAGALINYYKDTAYYSHAGSLSGKEISKLGAPYFLIWKIILDVKEKGFTKFNFWGALPKEVKSHALRGVSDFKMKFGGELNQLTGPVEVFNDPIRYNIQKLSDWWFYRKDRY
jgi:lipid II:glycine glycyltransferase (peptidoglycan interpeptide bridge formation enzyme)